MVLKNSKWDKKAKYKYLKKHGLTKNQTDESSENEKKASHPHWTSKKQSVVVNNGSDSDSDWDSEEDEALINHFYPNLGEEELTIDQKKKIRKQILAQLEEEEELSANGSKDGGNNEDDQHEVDQQEEEIDGIYLGTKPPPPSTSKETLSFDLSQILENAKSSKSSGKRYFKLKMSSNFLEEYGLENYNDTVAKGKVDSYNKTHYEKQASRNLQDIAFDELDNFEIGKSQLGATLSERKNPQLQQLSEQDMEDERRRQELVKDNKLYTNLRNKYSSNSAPKKNKILEINNLNSRDASQMENLNTRIANSIDTRDLLSVSNLDDDLAELLGEVAIGEDKAIVSGGNALEEILKASKTTSTKNATSTAKKPTIAPQQRSQLEQDAFLDELLG